MLTIRQLIELQNNIPSDMRIDGDKRNVKLMFHKIDQKRIDINPHYNLQNFEKFQSEHHNTFFAGTDYILSFWYEGRIAEFIGAYHLGQAVADEINDKITEKRKKRLQFPQMKSIDFLSEYKNRLFINWTNPTANYGRWIEADKYHVHSLKAGRDNCIGTLPRDYFQIRLAFKQLQTLFNYPPDNEEWMNYLKNRSGVYLILDISSGEQYVGSAYGSEGFWGRWGAYAVKGDGNVLLKGKDYDNFQFTILWETLNTTLQNDILNVECEIKRNLGTRVFGLNNN
ncbi:MAG: GIY-YIG nuclease family protein [Nitrospirota bacterium]